MRETASPSLVKLTTLRLGGKAIACLEPENMADIRKLPERVKELGGQPYVIGRGSNILAHDGLLPIVLIKLRTKPKIEAWARHGDKILIRAGGGVPMAKLLGFCLKNGLSGLEGLVGVPGSVGGATAMNAGSFGDETGSVLHALTVWSDSGLRLIYQKDTRFSYRALKLRGITGAYVILEAIFALTPREKGVIFNRVNLNFFEKKSRQPLSEWSAGCAFKNPPEGPSAGRLLEEAGFRGYSRGGVGFSSVHANFLINHKNGDASAALDLMREARAKVYERSGITLEPEVRIIPWPLA